MSSSFDSEVPSSPDPSFQSESSGGSTESSSPKAGQSRRAFLARLLAAGAGTGLAAATAGRSMALTPPGRVVRPVGDQLLEKMRKRRQQALKLRVKGAAKLERMKLSAPPPCIDEKLYSNRIGSHTKCLPHDDSGIVEQAAYDSLLKAVKSGAPADFSAVPKAGNMPLGNPQSGFGYNMESVDTWLFTMRASPPMASAETAGEMVENYWHALTRDIPFAEFGTNPVIAQAAADLSALSDFRGPKQGGAVTPATIFRGGLPGDLVGPFISQFFFKPIPHGISNLSQAYPCPTAGSDFVTDYESYLSLQRGVVPPGTLTRDPQPRYLRSQRDLTEWVHKDWPAQAFVGAGLILLGIGGAVRSPHLPYPGSSNQNGFVTFGIVDLMALLNQVTAHTMRTTWYYKWCVHRRLRPEAYAGHLHIHLTEERSGPFHSDILESAALTEIFARNGNYLLPQCYPEGAPPFPAYPSGHSAIAGACVTILKAFFREEAVLPDPVIPTADGSALVDYEGEPLTVMGELNKLASNIAIGRNMAGVHYRSDAIDGILLGEAVALAYLAEHRGCYNEEFDGFHLTKFDGTPVVV